MNSPSMTRSFRSSFAVDYWTLRCLKKHWTSYSAVRRPNWQQYLLPLYHQRFVSRRFLLEFWLRALRRSNPQWVHRDPAAESDGNYEPREPSDCSDLSPSTLFRDSRWDAYFPVQVAAPTCKSKPDFPWFAFRKCFEWFCKISIFWLYLGTRGTFTSAIQVMTSGHRTFI